MTKTAKRQFRIQNKIEELFAGVLAQFLKGISETLATDFLDIEKYNELIEQHFGNLFLVVIRVVFICRCRAVGGSAVGRIAVDYIGHLIGVWSECPCAGDGKLIKRF